MPCNARVVIKAKTRVENVEGVKKFLVQNGWQISTSPILSATKGQVYLQIVGKELELRSTADDWDVGVSQLKSLVLLLTAAGLELESIGQPETHRHEQTAPWQRVGH